MEGVRSKYTANWHESCTARLICSNTYDETNVYRYTFVNSIPEDKTGGAISFEERFPKYAKAEKQVVDFLVEDYIALVENPSVETIGMATFSTFGKPVKALDKSLDLIKDDGKNYMVVTIIPFNWI